MAPTAGIRRFAMMAMSIICTTVISTMFMAIMLTSTRWP
jgi:hypothetical protein